MTANMPISALAQSRTCLWVSADPRLGEGIVAIPANREMRGHLEATTVRAFLVSAGSPTAGVTEEAHLHCRKRASVHRSRIERMLGSGVSTGWFQSIRAYALCPPRKRSILDQGNKAMTTARIIDFINKTPKCTRRKVYDALAPTPVAPAAPAAPAPEAAAAPAEGEAKPAAPAAPAETVLTPEQRAI
eukprot:gene50717-62032_t